MRKTYSLIFASALLLLSLFASVSASVFTYDHYAYNSAPTVEKVSYDRTTVYDSYGNRRSETIVKNVDKQSYAEDYSYSSNYNYDYYPRQYSRNYKPFRDNDRVYVIHHQITCDAYGYNDCNEGDYTSFRQKPIYSYIQYGDDQYGYKYYYQPKYNQFKGYYDWRY